MTFHRLVPWLMLKRKFLMLRSSLFSLPRPEDIYYRVEGVSRQDLEAILGGRSFAPNYEFSYDKGEDLNLSRVIHQEERSFSVSWWQHHVRAYEVEDGVWDLHCHFEPEPTEHPHSHIQGVGLNRTLGMNKLGDVLDGAGLDYEELWYSR